MARTSAGAACDGAFSGECERKKLRRCGLSLPREVLLRASRPWSPLVWGAAAVAHYDALLRDPAWAAAHRPDLVLRIGDLPTSKPLRTWLAALTG